MIGEMFDLLREQEGFNQFPVPDVDGKLIIGYGYKLENGISVAIGTALALDKITKNRNLLLQNQWFVNLDPVRQGVIENMAYNIGIEGVYGFGRMIERLNASDYAGAASEMLNSLWATQVPSRARRLAEIMRSGDMNAVATG